jgi:UDP-N-acetylmuramoyl-L-alanyl-D-glutamate--2,6-diaminopimelate ligase
MEQYFAAKASLFTPEFTNDAVVNEDDVYGRLLIDAAEIVVHPFSEDDVRDIEITPRHHSFVIDGHKCVVPLGGRFNLHNSLAVIATARILGVPMSTIVRGLAASSAVPGRFESVVAGQSFEVVVDYAHTPDALENVLTTIAKLRKGGEDVITVVGCGGDRDKTKRPIMAQVACDLSTKVFFTSDNPRSEDPNEIIKDMEQGLSSAAKRKYINIVDRKEAIKAAVSFSKPGDIILIAGKGHEKYQDIKGVKQHFDDKEVLQNLFNDLAK